MSDTETLIVAAVLLYMWSQPASPACKCAAAPSSTKSDGYTIVDSSQDEVPEGYARDADGYLVEVDIGSGDTLDSIIVRQRG
jgi:hypothetical protein